MNGQFATKPCQVEDARNGSLERTDLEHRLSRGCVLSMSIGQHTGCLTGESLNISEIHDYAPQPCTEQISELS
jgi:hypothetical protein